jgi:branched-chain amino acid transport system substrate-binding protein
MKNNISRLALLAAVVLSGQQVVAQETWRIGQSAPLTGANAQFGQDIRDGALAWFKHQNAKGGVAGKPIELVSLDDKNERKLAGDNAVKLMGESRVLALFGYASATLSLDALPLAEKAGVPFFAPFSGANAVRGQSPVLFTVRASYAEELEKMLGFWTSLGLKRVIVIHYDDQIGTENFDTAERYLKAQQLQAQSFSIKRNTEVSKIQMATLISQKPEVLLNTVLSAPAAQIQKDLAQRGHFIPMSSLSFVGAQQFISAAGAAATGVSIAQTVPSVGSMLPAVRECAKAWADFGATRPMNSTHLEACFAARVLNEALKRARKPLTAETLLLSLRNMGGLDLGGFVFNFNAKNQHGSSYVGMGLVSADGRLRQ